MVPPSLFISGGIAVLHLCQMVFMRFQGVRRFRQDCEKLAHFVQLIETFITETEDHEDMAAADWTAAFSALHGSLLEVVAVFEDCARYGLLRSMITADDLNMRLNTIAQRLTLSLQLIPIQKAKTTHKRLAELHSIQAEIRVATFAAVSAAEEQSAALKRLMDQSRVDASKTQEMLEQVLLLLQTEAGASAAMAAAGAGPCGGEGGAVCAVDRAVLEAEMADLRAERDRAVHSKNATEQQYVEQVIAVIAEMELQLQQAQASQAGHTAAAAAAAAAVPADLRCPITFCLLVDPVILVESAQTYERAAIQEWLSRGNLKDPVTGVELTTGALVPNIIARKFAQEWLQTQRGSSSTQQQQQQDQEEEEEETSPVPLAPRPEAPAGWDLKPLQQQQQQQHGPCRQQQQPTVNEDGILEKSPEPESEQGQAKAPAAPAAAAPALAPPAAPTTAAAAAPAASPYKVNPRTAAILAAAAASATASCFKAGPPGAVASSLVASPESSVGRPGLRSSVCTNAGADGVAYGSSDGTGAPAVAAADLAPAERTSRGQCLGANYSNADSSSGDGGSGGGRDAAVFWRLAGVSAGGQQQQQQQQQPSLPGWQQQTHQQQVWQQPEQAWPLSPQGWLQQGQQPALPPVQLQHHGFVVGPTSLSSGGGGSSSSQERSAGGSTAPAAVAAAAAAAAAATGREADVSLTHLHATLGRAAETRHRMALRHGTADAAVMLLQRQQLQQERLQKEEKEYLQQHVARLMTQQELQQRQRGGSFSSDNSGTDAGLSFGTAGTAASHPSGVSRLQGDCLGASQVQQGMELLQLPPPQQQQQQQAGDHSRRCSSSGIDRQTGLPGVTHSFTAASREPSRSLDAASTSSRSHSDKRPGAAWGLQQQQQQRYVASVSTASVSSAVARHRSLGSDAGTNSVQGDDAVSVSSTVSGSSKRSVGKSLMSALKGLKYMTVYDDARR